MAADSQQHHHDLLGGGDGGGVLTLLFYSKIHVPVLVCVSVCVCTRVHVHACFVSVTVKCLVPGVVDGPSWNPFYNYYFTIISGITTGG